MNDEDDFNNVSIESIEQIDVSKLDIPINEINLRPKIKRSSKRKSSSSEDDIPLKKRSKKDSSPEYIPEAEYETESNYDFDEEDTVDDYFEDRKKEKLQNIKTKKLFGLTSTVVKKANHEGRRVVPWTDEEKQAIKEFIKTNGKPNRVTTNFIQQIKDANKQILAHRSIAVLRAHLHNFGYVEKS
ncbi:uncharacterized protein LOC131666689 [Phymastichus coffea]|nr:uncharacterized protein LOC131666689 [Phymastichus coffea]XP_058795533.1 uncharacterized protein LOC131666689 [Phymastichus coffea]